MGKNIVVCTFSSANNYGAVLQCYGLVKALNEIDSSANVKVYSDEKDAFSDIYRLIYKPTSLKSIFKMILNYPSRKKCVEKFNRFRNEFLKTTTQVDSADWNLFICGSDQVWNPKYVKDNSPYWGDVDMPKKCICASYAASLGVSNLNESEERLISEKLKKFDHISVRENSGKIMLEQLTEKKSATTL